MISPGFGQNQNVFLFLPPCLAVLSDGLCAASLLLPENSCMLFCILVLLVLCGICLFFECVRNLLCALLLCQNFWPTETFFTFFCFLIFCLVLLVWITLLFSLFFDCFRLLTLFLLRFYLFRNLEDLEIFSGLCLFVLLIQLFLHSCLNNIIFLPSVAWQVFLFDVFHPLKYFFSCYNIEYPFNTKLFL